MLVEYLIWLWPAFDNLSSVAVLLVNSLTPQVTLKPNGGHIYSGGV